MHEHRSTPTSSEPAFPPLPSLALAGSARGTRILARVLAIGVLLVVAAVFVMPWQQSVRGNVTLL